jgi:hypothetical protein
MQNNFGETIRLSINRYMEINIKTPWPEYASELYRLRDRRLSAKLVPAFADRGCHVVRAPDPYSRILGFLGRERKAIPVTGRGGL